MVRKAPWRIVAPVEDYHVEPPREIAGEQKRRLAKIRVRRSKAGTWETAA